MHRFAINNLLMLPRDATNLHHKVAVKFWKVRNLFIKNAAVDSGDVCIRVDVNSVRSYILEQETKDWKLQCSNIQ